MDVWSFEKKFGQGGQASTRGRRATVGHWLAAGQCMAMSRSVPYFLKFFYFWNFLFWKLGNGPGLLGEWMYITSIFWSLPLHLEVLNVPFLMEIGNFTFFQILFFLNLKYTWTFIPTVGIFVSWKIKITKNSSRFASVMEFFCIFLLCRVHLSMFHSSSTSKIWHTST
jgi:hypothetical protein